MDVDASAEPWAPKLPPDPLVLGLERKLDVLRAQLAACRAGRDPGEEGIATWSRLEGQSLRIAELEALVADLRGQLASAQAVSDTIAAYRPDAPVGPAPQEAPLTDAERCRQEVIACHATLRKLGQALIDTVAKEAYTAARLAEAVKRSEESEAAQAAERADARDRLHRTETLYEARLAEAAGRQRETEARLAELAERLAHSQAARDALTSSTCWRLTAPIRALGAILKGAVRGGARVQTETP